MPTLDQDREYLVWFEPHRDRWIASPIVREGGVIVDSDYEEAVTIVVVVDRRR